MPFAKPLCPLNPSPYSSTLRNLPDAQEEQAHYGKPSTCQGLEIQASLPKINPKPTPMVLNPLPNGKGHADFARGSHAKFSSPKVLAKKKKKRVRCRMARPMKEETGLTNVPMISPTERQGLCCRNKKAQEEFLPRHPCRTARATPTLLGSSPPSKQAHIIDLATLPNAQVLNCRRS